MLTRVALLLMCAVCACCEPKVQTLSSGLRLRTLLDCSPEPLPSVVVEALGDFSPTAQAVKAVQLDTGPVRLTGFPIASTWYRLTADTESFHGAALGRAADGGERFDALLLPLSRPCSVTRDVPAVPDESAEALVAGSDLLIVGGAGPASRAALREGFVIRVAEADTSSLSEGLLIPRAGAAAVAKPGETWILGGVTDLREGSAALDSFERFDAVTQRFLDRPGRMREGRYRAAALALFDGSVVLAGGLSSVGSEPLASIETLASDGQSSADWSEPLPFAADALALYARDDGRVLALATSEDALPRLALLDPRSKGVVALKPPALAQDATLEPSLVVSLPGARVGLFEVDGEGSTTGRLFLLSEEDYFVLPDPDVPGSDWLSSFAGVAHGKALALRDGRILLTGIRDQEPLSRVVHPGNRDVSVRPIDQVVDMMFMRDDGSALLLGPGGVQVFREDTLTPFDNPGGTLIADDSSVLCLDAYGRFEREGLYLRAAVAGARFDIAQLRYQDMRIELDLDGEASLLLRREDGSERAIEVSPETVGPAFCTLPRGDGDVLVVEREAERITLHAGNAKKSCQLDGMQGPLALALVAKEAGTLVRDLRVERR